jgi:hypothetical protein
VFFDLGSNKKRMDNQQQKALSALLEQGNTAEAQEFLSKLPTVDSLKELRYATYICWGVVLVVFAVTIGVGVLSAIGVVDPEGYFLQHRLPALLCFSLLASFIMFLWAMYTKRAVYQVAVVVDVRDLAQEEFISFIKSHPLEDYRMFVDSDLVLIYNMIKKENKSLEEIRQWLSKPQ